MHLQLEANETDHLLIYEVNYYILNKIADVKYAAIPLHFQSQLKEGWLGGYKNVLALHVY